MFRVMYYNNNNKEHQKSPTPSSASSSSSPCPQMSPRISFSNDFVEQHMVRSYRDAPVSSDFEFSVSNYSMMSADELFSHGRLLPLKETSSVIRKTTTLRDELQVLEDDESENDGFSLRPPRTNTNSTTRWKGFLGLKKSHIIGSKKIDNKTTISSDVSSAHQRSASFPDFVLSTKSSSSSSSSSQEMMNEGSSGSRNVEYRQ